MIAAAGSGKTQCIVKRALEILKHNSSASILITTYTINNREEIKERFLKLNNKLIPENITIQTWFSFLLQHGVRPYKYNTLSSNHNINGVLLVNKKSGEKTYIDQETGERVSVCITDSKTGKKQVVYWSEKEDVQKHYFSADNRVYTDKLSKFVFRCNQKSGGLVISRLSEIYSHIFIDEVQDLAGYDLELIKLLMKSEIEILMVGDPRQVIYLTHHESKHVSYKNGKIKEKGSFSKSKLKGEYIRYHSNGKIEYIGNYNNLGEETGIIQYFHNNGNLALEYTMKNAHLNGKLTRYFEDGSLHKSISFSENGTIISAKTFQKKLPEKKIPSTAAKAINLSAKESDSIHFKAHSAFFLMAGKTSIAVNNCVFSASSFT